MKLKNEQEIENLADSEHRHLNIARKVWTFKDGYKSGYTQAQQDLLASASESFEEWIKTKPRIDSAKMHSLKEAWRASKLSDTQWFIDSMAKVSEIERLKKENEELKDDLAYLLMSYAKQIDDDFREIVKTQVRSIRDKWFKGEAK